MPEVAGDCPKISLGEFFLDASVPNGPNYNTPELIGDLKKLTGPSVGENGPFRWFQNTLFVFHRY